jgi:transcriptional regulator with XRE-family HTH domain
MEPNDLTRFAGAKLKELRSHLGFTVRWVEERSIEIANDLQNCEYIVSHGWLTMIENGDGVPSIFKFYSLSKIYGRSVTEIAGYYHVPVAELGRDLGGFSAPGTHLLGDGNVTDSGTVTVPLQFRKEGTLDQTNLLSRLVAIWGDIPVALVERLSPQNALYGYVGLKDLTLFPLLRPGTFVQIDVNQRRVLTGPSRTLEERPIYFVELRDGYACSWCEVRGSSLVLIPHPMSPVKTRELPYPLEADIVGRVTAVAMRLA